MKNKTLSYPAIFFALFFAFTINFEAQTASLKATLDLQEINGVKIPFQNGIPLPSFEKQNRTTIDLSGVWKKQRFEANHDLSLAERNQENFNALETEANGRILNRYDDSGWEDKNIPSVENQMNTFPTVPEYYEDGVYYRYKFATNDSLMTKNAKLIFCSVNYIADVWLNENYLGYHEGGFTPFAFNVTEALSFESENVLVVRVDNIPWGSRKDIVPFYKCDWFNYAGIIHDVYLEFTNGVEIVRTDIVPQNIEGDLKLNIVAKNHSSIGKNLTAQLEIFKADINEFNIQSENWDDLKGNEVSFTGQQEFIINLSKQETGIINTQIKIANPNLWSPSQPDLYILRVDLLEDGNIKDTYHTQFGVRTIETDSNKVKLNDNIVFLTGGARHEDHPEYGRAIPKDIIYSDLKTVKEAKMNFLRTAHYPNSPYTYLMSDRIGLTIMEEIPVWWFDNEEEWLIQNEQRHIHEQMFREMVFKDYNRPSIILWSTSNECKEETNRLIYNQRIFDDIKNSYPDNRLISQSSAGDNPGSNDITQNPLDVPGWTLYFGVFHGGTYFSGTVGFLSRAKNAFPQKPLLDTEFGYWSSEDGSNTAKQVDVFNETFNGLKFFSPMNSNGSLNTNGILMGTTWWCVFDWYSHQHPNGFQSMGLISMDRQTTKPVYDALVSSYAPYFDKGGMIITGVETDGEQNSLPRDFLLSQNYPNPFNPTTTIKYAIPSGSREFVTVKVFDILGREIRTLVKEVKSPGFYEVEFDSGFLSSGIYIYKLEAGNTELIKKMMLIK